MRRVDLVIASGAKQSRPKKRAGLLRRFAPRNDEAPFAPLQPKVITLWQSFIFPTGRLVDDGGGGRHALLHRAGFPKARDPKQRGQSPPEKCRSVRCPPWKKSSRKPPRPVSPRIS